MMTLPNESIKIVKLVPDDILSSMKLDYLLSRLSEKEKKQVERFPFQSEKNQHVLTRYLLRFMFNKFYNRPFESFEFESDDKGKLSLLNLPHETPIYFNISHTKGMIACAFSKAKFIGIDIESTTREINHVDFANSIFSQAEFRQIKGLSEIEGRELFFKIWTLKEAYLKALGVGIVDNLNEINFDVLAKQITMNRSPSFFDQSNDWHWYLENPSPQHQLALAYRAKDPWVIESEVLARLD